MIAVTFDYGQTLAELDMTFLARRVAERGARVDVTRLEEAAGAAWAGYDAAKARGETGATAWGSFMRTLLTRAGTDPGMTSTLVDFLWSEQPRKNLWRRPIAGMEELVQDLFQSSVPLGIVSNSEGRLAELLEEMGLGRFFPVVADSGVLGFEKPDRRIFDYVTERLGVTRGDFVHVGDAWVADVEGALGAGGRALWVTRSAGDSVLPEGVQACAGAAEIRRALRELGVPV